MSEIGFAVNVFFFMHLKHPRCFDDRLWFQERCGQISYFGGSRWECLLIECDLFAISRGWSRQFRSTSWLVILLSTHLIPSISPTCVQRVSARINGFDHSLCFPLDFDYAWVSCPSTLYGFISLVVKMTREQFVAWTFSFPVFLYMHESLAWMFFNCLESLHSLQCIFSRYCVCTVDDNLC